MKLMTVTLLAALGTLAACGQKAESKAPAAAASSTTHPDAMAGMVPASQVGKMVKGTGIVSAVDVKAGTITLDHDAIADAGWPAMTMAFSAPADVVAKAKPGEKVVFDLRIEDKGGTVTAIEKQ